MAIHGLVHDTMPMEYIPQPFIPDSSCTLKYDGYMENRDEPNGINDYIISAFRECLEETDIKGKEFLRKFVSNEDLEKPSGRLAGEESRAKDLVAKIMKKVGKKMKTRNHDDFVVVGRGAAIDEALNQKLERFKVKTVNIGGVVKEDNK